jgi:hypothetical protein
MHRTYHYNNFTVDVDVEPVGEVTSGKFPRLFAGYVAVIRISQGGCSTTLQPLRVGWDNGRPFATEAETLMRGYGTAQRIIDQMITAGELSTKGRTP